MEGPAAVEEEVKMLLEDAAVPAAEVAEEEEVEVVVTVADREAAVQLFARLKEAVTTQRNVANAMQKIKDVFYARTTPGSVAAFECFRLSHLPMAAQLLADSAGDMARANLMSAVWWYATMYYRMNDVGDVDMLEQYVAAGLPAALSKVILTRCSVTADAAFNERFDKEFRALMPPQLRGEVVDVWRHVCSFLIESNRSSQMSVSLCSDILGEILYDVTTRRQPVLDVVPSFPAVVDKIMPFLRMPHRTADATANVCKLMRLVATGSNDDGFPLVWALIDGGACAWCVAQLAAFHREGKRIDVAITAISVVKLICDAVDHRFPPPPAPDAAAAAAAAAAAVDVDDGLSRPTSAAADAFVQSHLVDIGAGAAVAHAFDEMAKVWMTECAHGHSHLHPCVFRIFCGAFAQLGRHSPAFLRHFGAAQVTFRATAYEVVAALVVEVATRVGIQLALLRAMNALLGAMRKEPPIFTAFTDLLELLAHGIVTQHGTFGAPEEFFQVAAGGEGDDGGGPALLLAQPDDGDLDDVDGDGGGDGEDDGDGDGDGNLEEPV